MLLLVSRALEPYNVFNRITSLHSDELTSTPDSSRLCRRNSSNKNSSSSHGARGLPLNSLGPSLMDLLWFIRVMS